MPTTRVSPLIDVVAPKFAPDVLSVDVNQALVASDGSDIAGWLAAKSGIDRTWLALASVEFVRAAAPNRPGKIVKAIEIRIDEQ